jgi:hypothetical protein
MAAPENEVPVGIVPFGQLAESPTAWVGMTAVQVYTTGLSFTLSIRIRIEPQDLLYGVFDVLSEHGRYKIPPEQRLWLGVQYADGSVGTNHGPYCSAGFNQDRVQLHGAGGHGGNRTYDGQYWMAPIPPAGPLTFICTWPLFAIPETRTVVDAVPIREAHSRTRFLWPTEPRGPETPDAPSPPSAWFAEYL